MSVKIDRNIDIPEKSSGAPYKYPWHSLAVGDSFLMDNTHSPASMVRSYNNKLPKKNRIKVRSKIEGNKRRVWRIK